MSPANPTRRQWLVAAGALAAPAIARPSAGRPLVSAQFYVWTQYFASHKKTLAEGIGEAFAATRRAGYTRIELVSNVFAPELREKTTAALKEHGLELPVVYNGGPMHESAAAAKTVDETLALADLARPLGTRTINVNPNPKPRQERKSDDELAVQAHAVNQLAAELKQRGMKLELHHHNPEMAENAREWRHLLHHTDPGLVGFCIDVHWVYRGGQDPMTILREAGSRLSSLHLRNSKQGIWTEDFGPGDVNYTQVATYLKQSKFAGYLVVELAYEKGTAVTRSLEEDLRRSRSYTRKVFGV